MVVDIGHKGPRALESIIERHLDKLADSDTEVVSKQAKIKRQLEMEER